MNNISYKIKSFSSKTLNLEINGNVISLLPGSSYGPVTQKDYSYLINNNPTFLRAYSSKEIQVLPNVTEKSKPAPVTPKVAENVSTESDPVSDEVAENVSTESVTKEESKPAPVTVETKEITIAPGISENPTPPKKRRRKTTAN